MTYGTAVTVSGPFDQTVEAVRVALASLNV